MPAQRPAPRRPIDKPWCCICDFRVDFSGFPAETVSVGTEGAADTPRLRGYTGVAYPCKSWMRWSTTSTIRTSKAPTRSQSVTFGAEGFGLALSIPFLLGTRQGPRS